jgi:drug/metabolite transporter (DMT)-like permease
VANTTILLSLAPLFAAFLSRFVTGERIEPDTWVTAVVTALGVALVVGGSVQSPRWIGDALALLASLVVAGGLPALRCSPQVERIPVIMGSGVVTAALMLPWTAPLALDAASYPPLFTMGLLQIPLAMVLLAVATRYVSAPEVGLVMLLEIILGPLWVWLLLSEMPPRASVYGGVVVLVALLVYFGRRLLGGRNG